MLPQAGFLTFGSPSASKPQRFQSNDSSRRHRGQIRLADC
jgi:hypothetical protein